MQLGTGRTGATERHRIPALSWYGLIMSVSWSAILAAQSGKFFQAMMVMRFARVLALSLALSLSAHSAQAGDLPDPVKTPGALNPDVTQETIRQTICVPGWTASVRSIRM